MLQGQANATNCQVDNLQQWVVDLESQLVKLAVLEAAFSHFTNEHWVPLQAIIISLHNTLCWSCRGDGEPVPNRVQLSLAPPSLSTPISVPVPRSGRRPATPGPPPLSPVTSNDSSIIPNPSTNSSPNPFFTEKRTFQAVQGLDGLVWTNKERAALQAFLSNFAGEEGDSVTIFEAGEGDRSPGGSRLLSEGVRFREGGTGA